MRYIFAIVLALAAHQATSAERLVGTAVLKYHQQSKYQPGSCAEQALAKADGKSLDEVCIDMWSWQIYKVNGFRDLKGNQHEVNSVVATAHNPYSGEFLLVVEKLPDEEAARFGTKYKVIDRSPIVPFACLEDPITEYMKEETPAPLVIQGFGVHCYDIRMHSRK